MARMGHDDMRAALIYQRESIETDRRIAEGLSALVDELDDPDDENGPAGALVPVG